MLHCSISFTRPLKGMRHSKENQNSQAKLRVSHLLKLKYEFAGWGRVSVHTRAHLLCLCMSSSQSCAFSQNMIILLNLVSDIINFV